MFGEGFQLDSSLSYHSGDNEGIEGDLDVVVPLWNGGRHAIFVQPGFVFWTGLAEEERIDGNVGLVYRAELTKDLIAGASVFYDHDFQIGHSRLAGGIDLQSGFFRFGANYYHPLGEERDGREGFIEEVLRGMDARLVFEREVVRLGSAVGYWEYDGGEDIEDEWKTSIGMDFGFRVLPGVFIEGNWERHKDDFVLDERIFAGLAFRFSLPDFKGASYGNGEMSSNLHKIVDREKRILYEERVTGPRVSIIRTGNETIPADPDADVTIAVDIQLSEALQENVTINLVGSGSATYNDDYTVSVGGTDCPMVTEDNCPVTITAGQLGPSGDVEITIIDDGRNNEPAEDIVLSMVVAGDADLMLGNPNLSFAIPADLPVPSVSLHADNANIAEGGSATLTVTLTEEVSEDVIINLLEGGAADYGADMDWHLNNGSDCSTATGTSCQITIMANQRSTTATVSVNNDTNNETSPEIFTVSIGVASAGSTGVITGNASSLTFTIPAEQALPTVSLSYSGNTTIGRSERVGNIFVVLSKVAAGDVTLNIRGGGTVGYGGGVGTYVVTNTDNNSCSTLSGTDCQVTISEGETSPRGNVLRPSGELSFQAVSISAEQTIVLRVEIDPGSRHLVQPGSPSMLEFTIGN